MDYLSQINKKAIYVAYSKLINSVNNDVLVFVTDIFREGFQKNGYRQVINQNHRHRMSEMNRNDENKI